MSDGDGFLGDGFATPEEAALAGYPPGQARVLDVKISGDKATVTTEVNASTVYFVWEHCERCHGRWFNTGHAG